MISRILVGVDGSPQGDKAFEFGVRLTAQFACELHCCTVVYGAEIEMAEARDREAMVDRLRDRMTAHQTRLASSVTSDGLSPQLHVLEGHPAEQILDLAEQLAVDHIVLGHRSKGLFERLLMGSVAKRVVDFARCSVTVVR